MREKITIEPFNYKNEKRIKVIIPFEKNAIRKIKTVNGRKWSKTHNCWHVPYNKKSYAHLKSLFDIEVLTKTGKPGKQLRHNAQKAKTNNSYDKTKSAKPVLKEIKNTKIQTHTKSIKIELHDKRFYIKVAFDENKIKIIKNLQAAWWNPKYKNWVAKANIANLTKIQDTFNYWDDETYEKIYKMIALIDDPLVLELYRAPDNIKRVWVKIGGYRIDVDFMKQIPDRYYDKRLKRWSIPNDQKIIDRIVEHYKSLGAKINNRLPVKNVNFYLNAQKTNEEQQQYLINKYGKINEKLVRRCSDVMISQRYSWNTIRTYVSELVRFGNYVRKNRLTKVESADVNRYISEIALKKISDSKLNTIVSSLKFYFTKVVFRPDFKIENIKRPRKSLTLPYILSKQEIESILSSLDNIKHVTILYTLYSSGIRLAELLNLRVEDVNFDRNQVFIRSGKGKKDRVVMLSPILKELLVLYTDKYKPVYWLFEGQDKQHQYSPASVRNVVKQATRKAGITKRVTPHKIRHCFATHLLDGGTDLRYIQELLGHKDIKTTLIYTHVTTKDMTQIKSPLDGLNLPNGIYKTT